MIYLPGVNYAGWAHRCNLNAADFNNDLHLTKVKGDACTLHFNGMYFASLPLKIQIMALLKCLSTVKSYGVANLKKTGNMRRNALFLP